MPLGITSHPYTKKIMDSCTPRFVRNLEHQSKKTGFYHGGTGEPLKDFKQLTRYHIYKGSTSITWGQEDIRLDYCLPEGCSHTILTVVEGLLVKYLSTCFYNFHLVNVCFSHFILLHRDNKAHPSENAWNKDF